MRAVRILGLSAVVVILGAACGGSEPSAGSPPVPSPTESPTGSPTPSETPVLEDGHHFGFIKAVDVADSPHDLVFDLAQWFTGEEANTAAREDGVIGPDESVSNDYYIRNENTLLRTLSFEDDVDLQVIDWNNCCELRTGQLEPFAAAFEDSRAAGSYRGSLSPYWVTVAAGEVVRIEEQYLP
jgi:hypothetical protein